MELEPVCKLRPIERLQEVSDLLAEQHPGFDLLAHIEQRLATCQAQAMAPDSVQAIAVALQSPAHLDGLQPKDPAFQAWQKASYQFLCKEFGQQNLVYLSLAQAKVIPAIHCIFVPITAQGLLSPKALVGSLAQQQALRQRYEAALEPGKDQAARATPKPLVRTKQQRKLASFEPLAAPNRFYEQIKADLERVRREVNLIDYAISQQGYCFNKAKSCQRYAVLDQGRGTDKLIIPTRPNKQGYWTYKSSSNDKDSGTIVDFMLNRGYSFKQICQLSSMHVSTRALLQEQQRQLPEPITNQRLQAELAQQRLDRFKVGLGKSYLEQRGLSASTYQGLVGVKTNERAALFGLYEEVSIQGEGRLCSTLHYKLAADGSSRKYFQTRLPRGLAVFRPAQGLKAIVITESPIDALSHKQLYAGVDILYLSTCGSLSAKLAASLAVVCKQAQEQRIALQLCFDRDEAGRQLASKLEELASQQGLRCQVQYPRVGKDWNEQLQAYAGFSRGL